MEEIIEQLINEFSFYKNDILYYQNLIKKNPHKSLTKLRTIIKEDLQKSWQNKEYTWLINYFRDLKGESKKEALALLTKKIETLSRYNLIIDLNLLDYLLKNSPALSNCLETIFNNESKITEDLIDKMTSIENVSLLLLGYATLKNLINEDEEVIDDFSYNLSKRDFRNEIRQIPVMPKEEQLERFKQIEDARKIIADEASSMEDKRKAQAKIERNKQAILEGNLRLIIKPASKYATNMIPFDDLFQEGYFGLDTAVDRFELSHNCVFSTYAMWWIQQKIKRYIQDNGNLIRRPVHLDEAIKKYQKCVNALTIKLKREPTVSEIATEMKINKEKVKKYQKVLTETIVSINMTVDNGKSNEDSDTSLENFIPADEDTFEDVSNNLLSKNLNDVLSERLTLKEEDIIRMRLGIPHPDPSQDKIEYHSEHTLEECAGVYNITRERIRQIEAKALKKLRNKQTLRRLDSYTDVIIKDSYYQPFWANFKGIEPIKVMEAIRKLSKEDQAKLYELYGNNLNSNDLNLTPYEYQKRGEIVTKIQRILNPYYIEPDDEIVSNPKIYSQNLTKYLNCSWGELYYLTDYLDESYPIYLILTKLFGSDFQKSNNILGLNNEDAKVFNEWLKDMDIILRLKKSKNKTFEGFFYCSLNKKKAFLESIFITDPQYNLLFTLWGRDLNDKLKSGYLYKEQKEEFIYIYKEVKKYLAAQKEVKSKIYSILETSSSKLPKIQRIILNNPQYKDLFQKVFGENLDEEENLTNLSTEEKKQYREYLTKIKTILKDRSERKICTTLSVYEMRFFEVKDLIFNQPKYKDLFQKVFGDDLMGKQNIEALKEEEVHLYLEYLDEIKSLLKNSKDKKLHRVLGISTKVWDKARANILKSPKYRPLFIKVYGNNLLCGENLDGLTDEERKLYKMYVDEIRVTYKKRKLGVVLGIASKDLEQIRQSILDSPKYRNLFQKVFGYKLLDSEDISKLTLQEREQYSLYVQEIKDYIANLNDKKETKISEEKKLMTMPEEKQSDPGKLKTQFLFQVMEVGPRGSARVKRIILYNPQYKDLFQKVFGKELDQRENMDNLTQEEQQLYQEMLKEAKEEFRSLKKETPKKKAVSNNLKLWEFLGLEKEAWLEIKPFVFKENDYKYFKIAYGDNLDQEFHNNFEKVSYSNRFYQLRKKLKERVESYLETKDTIKALETKEEAPTEETVTLPKEEEEILMPKSELTVTTPFEAPIFAELADLLPVECRYFTKLRIGVNPEQQIYSLEEIAKAFNSPLEYVTEKVNQGLAYFTLLCKGYEEIFNHQFPMTENYSLERKKDL